MKPWSKQSGSSKEPRKRDPRKLSDVLPQLMARRGYNRLLTEENYTELWEEIAGHLSKHSRPGQIRRGVLEIVASNSAVVQELTFQKRQLTKAISERMPDQKIRDLRFVVGSVR